MSKDTVVIVAASMVGSTAGYYGLLLLRQIMHAQRAQHARQAHGSVWTTVSLLALGSGSVELLDCLVFSPALLYISIRAVPNLHLAIVLGEVASNSAFYTVVLGSHKLRHVLAGAGCAVGRNRSR